MKSLMCVIVLYFIPSISPHDIMHCQFPLHYLFFSSKKKRFLSVLCFLTWLSLEPYLIGKFLWFRV